MTEKEKAKQGLLYNPNYDEELIKERTKAQELCHEYNQLLPSEFENRGNILTKLCGKIGKQILIEQPFYCDYGYNIEIGDNFYAAPNCGLYTAGHQIDYKQRNSGIEYAKPITIGDNVWIGGNAVILPGVTIGNNVVIGAGSVVTKEIPSNCVAYGNPCKVAKNIEINSTKNTI